MPCEQAWSVCNDMQIDSYPTLAMFAYGQTIKVYQKPTRDLNDLIDFALEDFLVYVLPQCACAYV